MTLIQRSQLINDLIKENPRYTIRDYIEVLKTVESIETFEIIEPDMNTPKLYSVEQAEFIIKHHQDMTVRQIAENLEIDEATIRNFGSRNNLTFKKPPYLAIQKHREPVYRRPAAIYSNHSPYGIADALHQIKTA